MEHLRISLKFLENSAQYRLLSSTAPKDIREKVQRLVEPRAFSHSEATKDFGYNPLNFEEGVKPEIEEYIKKKEYGRCIKDSLRE